MRYKKGEIKMVDEWKKNKEEWEGQCSHLQIFCFFLFYLTN